jgi:hypothetical protein
VARGGQAGRVDAALQEREVRLGIRERRDDRVEVAAQILARGRRAAQQAEQVLEPQAGVVGGDDDEPAAGPVGHELERLRAEARGAVDEHDDRVGAVGLVDREVAPARAVLPGVGLVGDLALLGVRQRGADVVADRGLAGLAAGLRGVPDLEREAVDHRRARADRPRAGQRGVLGDR